MHAPTANRTDYYVGCAKNGEVGSKRLRDLLYMHWWDMSVFDVFLGFFVSFAMRYSPLVRI